MSKKFRSLLKYFTINNFLMKFKPICLIFISLLLLFSMLVVDKLVLIICLLILFEKCLLARINPIGGIEFTTLATVLITLKFGVLGGIYLCLFIIVVPFFINVIMGERFIINPSFNPGFFGPGNIRDFISVFIVHLLKDLNPVLITLVVVIFKNIARFEGFGESMIISTPLNVVFNLFLINIFQSFII